MTRKLKRTRDFEIVLQLKTDGFLMPPRDSQRGWMLHQALSEWANDLVALDKEARDFVPGATIARLGDRTQAELGQQEIMEDWLFPVMEAMSDIVTETHGDVLEIGYGRGISSRFIQERGVRSHTVIECNDPIMKDAEAWKAEYPNEDIRLVHSLWQDAIDDLPEYDGVFFHTYPLNQDEMVEHVIESTTFAAHFFEPAARLLKAGGIFTYMTNEIDSLSRQHQRELFEHFSSVTIQRIDGLSIPEDVADAWWSPRMVVVKAVK